MNSFGPDQPTTAHEDFLASWLRSRGNVRRFIEQYILPPGTDASQRAAGEAAAMAALSETYGLDFDDFSAGVESVSGAFESAGRATVTAPDPDIPQDPGAAAFFDIDNTLIQGASLIMIGTGMFRRRFVTFRDVLPMVWKQAKFRFIGAEDASDVASGREQALDLIRGQHVADLVELSEEIVNHHMLEKIWPGTRELAEMHLAAGQQVWLVSATPVQVAQILAQRLGLTGALGTVAEVDDAGRFTGKLVGDILHGAGKTHAVAALAAVNKLDLERCTAYSDSVNDIPMLSMVGTPVAINPDRPLFRYATERGWTVRDYRHVRRAIRTVGLPVALLGVATAVGAGVVAWRRWGRE